MSVKVKMAFLGFICLSSLALGCVELAMLYHDKTVSNAPVVALQEGSAITGRWETFDLVINYQYTKKVDSLKISAQAALSSHYQMTYDKLAKMRVYIFFLDKDSRVMETALFADTWSSNTRDVQEISSSYKTPPGTAGFSFGYSGQVRDGKSTDNFYKLPLD
ncbi:MAG: hypothetical protein DRH08_09015 [Deltaproteobacteria bacterium]|nr:MAG: hypothetical protein DRH08_09015 [Deltaproteobacteria bacterium]